MGITSIGMSKAERDLRDRDNAIKFSPKAKAIIDLLLDIVETSATLQKCRTSMDVAGLLDKLQKQLRAVSALTRGFNPIVKPHNIPDDVLFCYNLAKSLQSVSTTLPFGQVSSELKKLAGRLSKLSDNAALMNKAVQDMAGPQNPDGQPAQDGTVPEDTLEFDDGLEDAPNTQVEFDEKGMNQFSLYDNDMPGPGNPELVKTYRLPVMASFNRPTSIDELGSRGFDAINVGGFVVLRRVYIIGINTARCGRDGVDPARVLDAALAKISEAVNDKLAIVCATPIRYHKGGWLFYWYGPQNHVDAIGGKLDTRLYVTEFKFPFGGGSEGIATNNTAENLSRLKAPEKINRLFELMVESPKKGAMDAYDTATDYMTKHQLTTLEKLYTLGWRLIKVLWNPDAEEMAYVVNSEKSYGLVSDDGQLHRGEARSVAEDLSGEGWLSFTL